MAGYKEIKEIIQNNFNNLPKNQRKIAEFFIDNFDRIPFLNVKAVSNATSASVASIVRFAQRIGFNGYSQLKDEVANSLQDQLSNRKIFPLFKSDESKQDILTSVANLDIKNINETLNMIEADNFNKTVDIILKSKKVYTAGLGISFILSEILAYQLNQVLIEARALKHDYYNFHEQAVFLNKSDLIIAFSFPPYSKETIEVSKYAHEKSIKVISITNKETSPITFYSTEVLLVKSENMLYTNSFAAISVLINAIATACAVKNKTNAKKIFEEAVKFRQSQDVIIS